MSRLIKIYLFFQVAILAVSILSIKFLPYRQNPYHYLDDISPITTFLSPRANFDGIHYLSISENGYGLHQQAFFPLFPNLIRSLEPLFGRPLLVGLFISVTCGFAAIVVLYKLVQIDYPKIIAWRTVVMWLLFPTSFFLGMVYTESLFTLFIFSAFYSARKEKWLLAGILGALASNTRLVGIFVFPAILWEFYARYKNDFPVLAKNIFTTVKNLRQVSFSKITSSQAFTILTKFVAILIAPLGLLTYMRYLALNYADPLKFVHAQPFFGAARSDKLILYYQVVYRYIKMILTTTTDPLYLVVWLELLISLAFLLIIYLTYRKNIRLSYLIFAIPAYILPTLTGTFSSMPRYVLVLFPLFIYLGILPDSKIYKLARIILGIAWVVSCAFFLRGYWVA